MANVTRRDALALAGLSLATASPLAAGAQPLDDGRYLILACDGGGMRGLLAAKIIKRLQSELPFLDRIDLFAGTSTGGILALGLANRVSIDDLVDLYRKRGPQIFSKAAPKPRPKGRLKDWLDGLGDRTQAFLRHLEIDPRELVRPKYDNDGLKQVLTDVLGDTELGSVKSGKSVMVTTLRLFSETGSWAPRVIHNVGPDEQAPDTRVEDRPLRSTTLVDAALCTTAAPLYFPPYRHPELGYCVDGGMYANCPASMAMALALRATRGNLEHVRILSIGTGTQASGIDIPNSRPFDDPSEYGALAWLDPAARGKVGDDGTRPTPKFPLLSALFDASSASHNYICAQAMGTKKYHRVQVRLARPIALDETAPASLSALEEAADNIPQPQWQEAVDWVKQHFG